MKLSEVLVKPIVTEKSKSSAGKTADAMLSE